MGGPLDVVASLVRATGPTFAPRLASGPPKAITMLQSGQDRPHPRYAAPSGSARACFLQLALDLRPCRHVEAGAESKDAKEGKAAYRRRKWIAEPPNGWIKSVLGFRQFSLRGLHRVQAEFKLVCLALNLRRMGSLKSA